MPSILPPPLSDGDLRLVTSDSETTGQPFDAVIEHGTEMPDLSRLVGDDIDDIEVHFRAKNDPEHR